MHTRPRRITTILTLGDLDICSHIPKSQSDTHRSDQMSYTAHGHTTTGHSHAEPQTHTIVTIRHTQGAYRNTWSHNGIGTKSHTELKRITAACSLGPQMASTLPRHLQLKTLWAQTSRSIPYPRPQRISGTRSVATQKAPPQQLRDSRQTRMAGGGPDPERLPLGLPGLRSLEAGAGGDLSLPCLHRRPDDRSASRPPLASQAGTKQGWGRFPQAALPAGRDLDPRSQPRQPAHRARAVTCRPPSGQRPAPEHTPAHPLSLPPHGRQRCTTPGHRLRPPHPAQPPHLPPPPAVLTRTWMRRGGRPAAGQGRARRSGTGLRWASPRGRRLALVGRRPHPTRDPRPAARSPAQKTGAAGGRRSVSSPFLPAPSRHRAAPRPPAGGRGGTGRGGEGRRGLAGESGTGREEGTEGRRESRR